MGITLGLAITGAAVIAALGMRAWAVGFVCGVLLSALNYWGWKKVVARFIQGNRIGGAIAFFICKMALNGAVLFGAIRLLHVNAIAFLLGIGGGIIGLVVSGLWAPLEPPSIENKGSDA